MTLRLTRKQFWFFSSTFQICVLQVEVDVSRLLSHHKLLLRDQSDPADEDSGLPEASKALDATLRTLMKTRVPM